MRQIASTVGVQMPTLYYYYNSKHILLYEIMSDVLHQILAGLKEAIHISDDPIQRFRKAMEFHVLFHCKNKTEVTIIDSELRSLEADHYNKIIGLRDEYEGIIKDIIYQGVAEGVMAVDDVKIASYAVITMGTAVLSWYKEDGRLSPEVIAGQYADLGIKFLAVKP